MAVTGSLVGRPSAAASVEQELEQVEAWIAADFASAPATIAPLLAHAARFRGKRVRALQVLLVARACGGAAPEHRILGGVIELIHAATLAHDDLLDEATERRGNPSLHEAWGPHAAVLLGDWLYARAFLHCTRLEDQTASRVLARATARMCGGEIHQNLTRRRFDLTEADYLDQIDGKTAALFEAGGRLAAHYAGAEPAVVEGAGRHGMLAGRAFQLADDLLDLDGNSAVAAKSLGTDWQRGKMTLPLIRMRDGADAGVRARLESAFLGGEDRAALRQPPLAAPFARALDACRGEIRACLDQACAALQGLPDGEARADLVGLTRWLGARDR
jgi:octaprenyl-diphosphate synthase